MFTATIVRRKPGRLGGHRLTVEVIKDETATVEREFECEAQDLPAARAKILEYLRMLHEKWNDETADTRFVGQRFSLDQPHV